MRKIRTAIWIAGFVCAAYFVVGAVVRSRGSGTCVEARRFLRLRNPERARDTLSWLLWFQPDHPDALHISGLSYLLEKNYPAAINDLSSVPSSADPHRQVQTELVAAMLADYRMEQAEVTLRDHLNRYPDEIEATTQLHRLLLAEWRIDASCKLLLDHISHKRFRGWTVEQQLNMLRMLAKAEFDAAPPDSCIPLLMESFDHHPDQDSVALAIGICHWKSGDFDRGRWFLDRTANHSPVLPERILARAEFQIDTDDLAAAETLLHGLVKTTPQIQSSHDYCRVKSMLEERRGDPEVGLKFARQALKLRQHDRAYHARVARLLQKAGEFEKAPEYYERSHVIAQNELALWKLTRSLPAIPTPEDCRRTSDHYLQLDRPVQADAWSTIAERLELHNVDNIGSEVR